MEWREWQSDTNSLGYRLTYKTGYLGVSENGVYPENRHLVGMVHHEIWGDLIRQTIFLTIWLVSDGRDHENGWIYLDFLM